MISAFIVRKRREGSESAIYNRWWFSLRVVIFMRKLISTLCVVLLSAVSLAAQGKRLWVLRAPGKMVEYDPSTFPPRQTVKVPAEAPPSPPTFPFNHLCQILFPPPIPFPPPA